jgi:(p)ppGpp synthase/HD superfamily hydrolase
LAAVLHDVIEDSPAWTVERLRGEGFPEAVIRAVDLLTKREGEPYDAQIDRAAADPVARLVKLADLEDNMMQTRIAHPAERDRARLDRYRLAHERLGRESRRPG